MFYHKYITNIEFHCTYMYEYISINPGPPVITLFDGSTDTFSLLPPDTNNAEVEVLTQNVVLSTNLVGRWYRPDNSYVTQNSLTFTIFHQSNEGLYKFYVTDWNGELTLAIQIDISIMGMLHTEISCI